MEEHEEEIAVFYLPSYSPELNPDEHLKGTLTTVSGLVFPPIIAGTRNSRKTAGRGCNLFKICIDS
jgi:hypothetical protein